MSQRIHVIISGRVQGVWFRDWTQQNAVELGLAGWVRNRDDGCVEAVIEGKPDAVEELVTRMHQGPENAHVTGVEAEPEVPTGEFSGFEVIL
ncbi:MAG: acylphosphatase [Bdellovibrionales bacterium]|nr:acylphosphatase [Bdellovibrionales bacterium]